MEDTVKTEKLVKELSAFIEDHKGIDTVAIYIGEQSSFTDYFIITTVSSFTHLKGLFREIKAYLAEQEVKPLHHQKIMDEDTWVLVDCGNFVIHLMEKESRDFYELEKLWFTGKPVFQPSKSSKSSPSS